MTRLFAQLPDGRDVGLAVLLFAVVVLMVLPLPTPLVDVLIGLNFGIAILLMMTAVYLPTPLSLSSLPGIILIATLFRLSLSVTTTRLILAEADAGAIVAGFGSVVVAGNVVVGLVVFFIITVVQFIVIAKGAERIAEVGARFTLDALPGKQMAIDAEMRNGDIDAAEATRRRDGLGRESQFYGAMDGAMKFVKGDAIAGIVIIAVNLIGGLLVGMAQFGMPFGEAAVTYSLLTVGDALISQIPALLVSISAAVIVTRVKSERQANLSADIVSQVTGDRRAVALAGVALAGMGLVPGFPTHILVPLGAAFLGGGVLLGRMRPAAPSSEAVPEPEEAPPDDGALPAEDEAQAALALSPALLATLGEDAARRAAVAALAVRVGERSGVPPVALTALADLALAPAEWRLRIAGAVVHWGRVDPERAVVADAPDGADPAEVLAMHDLPYEIGEGGVSLEPGASEAARALGLTVREPGEVLLAAAEEALLAAQGRMLGIEEAKTLLSRIEGTHPVLLGETLKVVSIQRVAEVFSRLLEERVRVAATPRILEALVQWGARTDDPVLLTEHCRIALRQQICEAASDHERVIAAVIVEREAEGTLREGVRETNVGRFLVLGEEAGRALLAELSAAVQSLGQGAAPPVVMTSMDVRRHLKTFLARNRMPLDVLSFQELSDDYTVVPCGTLKLPRRAA